MAALTQPLKQYRNTVVTDWFDRFSKGLMQKFLLPTNDDDRLAVLYQLLLKIRANEVRYYNMCLGGDNIHEAAYQFNDAVSRPLIRGLSNEIDRRAISSRASPRSVPVGLSSDLSPSVTSFDYTYKKPDEEEYLDGLTMYLASKGENVIADLLKGAKCTIQPWSTYSESRGFVYRTSIYFQIPPDRLPSVTDEMKQKLTKFCNDTMPKDAGFEIVEVDFSPLLGKASDAHLAQPIAVFESLNIHPEIRMASAELFRDGHYSQSILEAYKALNNLVKARSGRTDLDGKPLMSTVFSRDKPILALNPLGSTSDKDEQEGFMLLYMGAMVGIRNPKAHEMVQQDDPFKTLEYLALASLLAKRVDEARKLQG
jgi:uncharacterized protein (TIGR02391 family)